MLLRVAARPGAWGEITSGWSGRGFGGMALAEGLSNSPAASPRRSATPLGLRQTGREVNIS